MVDKSGLKVIGWLFGGATAAVMVVAAMLVTEAGASNPPTVESQTAIEFEAAAR